MHNTLIGLRLTYPEDLCHRYQKWSKDFVKHYRRASRFDHCPALLARAYAAELTALQYLSGERRLRQVSTKAAFAFDFTPLAQWHVILEALSNSQAGLSFSAQVQTMSPLLERYTKRFLSDVHMSTDQPSRHFFYVLSSTAAKFWENLPDKAELSKTKFQVFCDRFNLSYRQRKTLRDALLDRAWSLAKAKKHSFSEIVDIIGMRDPESIQRIERAFHDNRLLPKAIRRQARRQDVDDILAQYATKSAHLRRLLQEGIDAHREARVSGDHGAAHNVPTAWADFGIPLTSYTTPLFFL